MTPKLDRAVFRFLSTAVLSDETYLPTKFHVDISYGYVPDKKVKK
jgi:hypothetical protein